MVCAYFGKGAMKRTVPREPFIHDNTQRILVTACARVALDLLWGHIGHGASDFLGAWVARTLGNERNTKIGEQHRLTSSHEHIFRFDITMDELLLVCILECLGDL